jgi:4-carboxymuconolactone decarboxylase
VIEPLLSTLDEPTIVLIQLAAAIAGGDERSMRDAFAAAAPLVPARWIEELVLQSYLFSGFPRALNAAREWRRVSPEIAPEGEDASDYRQVDLWRERGEATCAAVYGDMYERLRQNVRQLHPALDAWMVVEGYGKVLGRPGLDLGRRELCVVAACAASGQERQLHSHLHGALNVGVSPGALREAIDALRPALGGERIRSVHHLLARVLGK